MSKFKDVKWKLGGISGRMITTNQYGGFVADVDTKQNALLISKAPELLEMLKRVTAILEDIDTTLAHHNHEVLGWHLNGDTEPIMNFFDEIDMESITAANNLIKEATEI